MKKENLEKKFILFLCVFVGIIAYSTYFYWQKQKVLLAKENVLEKNWQILSQEIESKINNFPGRVGLVIKDLESNKIITYNQDVLFPSASLVKIPIMAACFQAETEGKINFLNYYRLKGKYKAKGSGVLKNLRSGGKITIQELIELMITKSDNTATHMLTEILGFDYLNRCFLQFGLHNTNLLRHVMDLRKYRRGIENYTTAFDIATLLEKIYFRTLVSQSASEKMLSLLEKQEIRDRLPRYLPSNILVAHKTGLFDTVCHDVGIIFHPQGNFLICVLVSDHAEHNFAKELIGQIAKLCFDFYEKWEEKDREHS